MARPSRTSSRKTSKVTKKKVSDDFEGFSSLDDLKALAASGSGGQGRWFRFTEDGTEITCYIAADPPKGVLGFYQHGDKVGNAFIYRMCKDQKGENKKKCPYCLRGIKRGAKVWAVVWNITEKKMQIMAGGNDLLQRLLNKREKYETLVGYRLVIKRTGTSYDVEDYFDKKPNAERKAQMKAALADFNLAREFAAQVRRDDEKEKESPSFTEMDLEDDEEFDDELDEDLDDDDEDLDEDEDDDEEDEDDDEDEEDDEDDEGDDEDDESEDDEDEDEGDLDDEDEEEEEEPPARVRKKRVVKRSAKVASNRSKIAKKRARR